MMNLGKGVIKKGVQIMKKQFFKIFVLLFFIGNLSFTENVSNKWKVFGNKEYDIEISKGRRRLNDEISVDDEGVY